MLRPFAMHENVQLWRSLPTAPPGRVSRPCYRPPDHGMAKGPHREQGGQQPAGNIWLPPHVMPLGHNIVVWAARKRLLLSFCFLSSGSVRSWCCYLVLTAMRGGNDATNGEPAERLRITRTK